LGIVVTVVSRLGADAEIVVVTDANDRTAAAAASSWGCRLVVENGHQYGKALSRGIEEASGAYIATIDPDLTDGASFLETLWHNRDAADVIVASRYVAGGSADVNRLRLVLSRLLNATFAKGLDLPMADLSSAFRLYKRRAITTPPPSATGFDVLQQVLVR